jgi:hypothetical protein
MAPNPTTNVLYVAGAGRSGSTLLDTLLGQADGVFSAGELRYLWERGLIDGRLCGCGEPVDRCPVWSAVLEHAFGNGAAAAMAQRMVAAQRRIGRIRTIPGVMRARRHPERLLGELGDLPEQLDRLYRAVGEVTGAQVVVDSSKQPTYGWLVANLPSVDLRAVHLVRDARAAAFSWLRTKETPDRPEGGYMERRGVTRSAALWDVWNVATELLWRDRRDRYLRMRYEDLSADPQRAVATVLEFAGLPEVEPPDLDGDGTELRVTHTVAGNPMRMTSGRVTIRPDVEWKRELARGQRLAVTALCAPLLLHYRYPLGRGD